MYDVTSNELDRMILRKNKLSFVNSMIMLSCLFNFNPNNVTYTEYI